MPLLSLLKIPHASPSLSFSLPMKDRIDHPGQAIHPSGERKSIKPQALLLPPGWVWGGGEEPISCTAPPSLGRMPHSCLFLWHFVSFCLGGLAAGRHCCCCTLLLFPMQQTAWHYKCNALRGGILRQALPGTPCMAWMDVIPCPNTLGV